MGVSYAPFDIQESLVRPQKRRVAARVQPVVNFGGPDNSECAYLILFFVLGIFLLVFMDGV